MTCADIDPLLSAMLDDELSASERARVMSHLPACTGCAHRLEVLRQAQDLFRASAPRAGGDALPPSVRPKRRAVAVAAAVMLAAGIVAVASNLRGGSRAVVPAAPAAVPIATPAPLKLAGLDCRPQNPGPNCQIEAPPPCSSAQHCGAF